MGNAVHHCRALEFRLPTWVAGGAVRVARFIAFLILNVGFIRILHMPQVINLELTLIFPLQILNP